MLIHEMLKPWLGKACRSEFHAFISPVLPCRPAPHFGSDIFGGFAVLSLWAAMLMLMRLLLAT
jgi:hypothetical protein